MEVRIAVAKTRKYAVSNSGDSVEMIERPNGGLSVVMADGQSSGRGAKVVANLVVRKVITLLSEGIRDGAAARAASDYLFTERGGKVSATLNILSIDSQTNTLVITRNNPSPVILSKHEQIQVLDEPSIPIGLYRDTRPVISQIDLEPGLTIVMYTDGLVHAGSRSGTRLDPIGLLEPFLVDEDPAPQDIADELLNEAVRIDQGRPSDDICVVVMRVTSQLGDDVRRMTARLPLNS